MTWQRVRLLEVAPLVKDRVTPWVGVRRYIATGDADDEGNLGGVAITYEERPSRADLVGAPGDIAFARMAATAKVFVMDERASRAVFSTGFAILRPRPERANVHFLKHWLRSSETQLTMDSLSAGATQRALTNAGLGALEMPLPPVSEQQRIAAILDAADAIRAKRRAQLAHLDALPQALFHEMFAGRSDAVVPLGEVVPSIDSGVSPVAEPRAAVGDEWGVLKLGAVTYGKFRPWENKAFLGDASFLRRHEVKDGDVLMTRKNTPELVGAVVFVRDVPPRLAIPDLVFRLNIDHERLDGAYVQALLMSRRMRRRVRGLAGGSAASMSNISKSRLSALWIPVPPLALQQEFAAKVEAIHAERARVARALEADDELFAALQHRAFRGEL
ncbi:hypothetical protein GCM10027064_19000 [Microbacterium petrolearium]